LDDVLGVGEEVVNSFLSWPTKKNVVDINKDGAVGEGSLNVELDRLKELIDKITRDAPTERENIEAIGLALELEAKVVGEGFTEFEVHVAVLNVNLGGPSVAFYAWKHRSWKLVRRRLEVSVEVTEVMHYSEGACLLSDQLYWEGAQELLGGDLRDVTLIDVLLDEVEKERDVSNLRLVDKKEISIGVNQILREVNAVGDHRGSLRSRD